MFDIITKAKDLISSGGDAELISKMLNDVVKKNDCKGVIILLNPEGNQESETLVLPIPKSFDFEKDIENLNLFQDENLGNFEKLGDFYLKGKNGN